LIFEIYVFVCVVPIEIAWPTKEFLSRCALAVLDCDLRLATRRSTC